MSRGAVIAALTLLFVIPAAAAAEAVPPASQGPEVLSTEVSARACKRGEKSTWRRPCTNVRPKPGPRTAPRAPVSKPRYKRSRGSATRPIGTTPGDVRSNRPRE